MLKRVTPITTRERHTQTQITYSFLLPTMAAKIKPLRPTMRDKKRYVVVKVFADKQTPKGVLVNTAIRESINEWGGAIGAAACGYKFLDDLYDERRGTGIVRIRAAWLDHFRSALILVKKIGATAVMIDILGVSGILKKAAAVAAQR